MCRTVSAQLGTPRADLTTVPSSNPAGRGSSLSGTWRLSCPGPWPLEGSQPQRGAREHTGPAPGSVSRGQEQKALLGPLLGRGFRSKVPQPVLGPLTAGRAADCHVPAEPPGAPFPAHRGRANRSTCLPGQLWLRVRPRRRTGQRTSWVHELRPTNAKSAAEHVRIGTRASESAACRRRVYAAFPAGGHVSVSSCQSS